jgi:hypothetical protein
MIQAGRFFFILGAALALAAPGATARGSDAASVGHGPGHAHCHCHAHAHAHIVPHPFLIPRELVDARFLHRFDRFDHRRNRGGFVPGWGPYGGNDLGDTPPQETAEAGAPLPLPFPMPAAEPRVSVETTPEGVAVVRGPGSHHVEH